MNEISVIFSLLRISPIVNISWYYVLWWKEENKWMKMEKKLGISDETSKWNFLIKVKNGFYLWYSPTIFSPCLWKNEFLGIPTNNRETCYNFECRKFSIVAFCKLYKHHKELLSSIPHLCCIFLCISMLQPTQQPPFTPIELPMECRESLLSMLLVVFHQ